MLPRIIRLIGNDRDFPADRGFVLRPWNEVRFANKAVIFHGSRAQALGSAYFTDDAGNDRELQYAIGYVRDVDGRIRIDLSHMALPFGDSYRSMWDDVAAKSGGIAHNIGNMAMGVGSAVGGAVGLAEAAGLHFGFAGISKESFALRILIRSKFDHSPPMPIHGLPAGDEKPNPPQDNYRCPGWNHHEKSDQREKPSWIDCGVCGLGNAMHNSCPDGNKTSPQYPNLPKGVTWQEGWGFKEFTESTYKFMLDCKNGTAPTGSAKPTSVALPFAFMMAILAVVS